MWKKRISVLLAAALVVLCAGCGGQAPTSESSAVDTLPVQEAPGSISQTESSATALEASDISAESESAREPAPGSMAELVLPLTEDPVTFTYLTYANESVVAAGTQRELNYSVRALEDATGIHIEFDMVNNSAYPETLNLKIASDDLDDFVLNMSFFYSGAISNLVETGVICDMAPLIETDMVNFKGLLEQDPELSKDIQNDEGVVCSIPSITDGGPDISAPGGPMIRTDLLEQTGLSVPETYEDYEQVLMAFRDMGVPYPIGLFSTVFYESCLCGGYGINANPGGEPFYVVDDEVRYGFVQPEAKELLERMHTWYEEKLISDECFTKTAVFDWMDETIAGTVGIFYNLGGALLDSTLQQAQANDPDYAVEAIPDAVKEPGGLVYVTNASSSKVSGMSGLSIAASCSDPDLAAKWLDYRFTQEGADYCVWGVEGETYTRSTDGTPSYTDMIVNNPDYGNLASGIYLWTDGACLNDYRSTTESLSELANGLNDVWTSNYAEERYDLPDSLYMSTADAEIYSSRYSDIETYTLENVAKFVTGARDLSEWDTFVADIQRMGIDDCIQCWQNAYDKYQIR